MNITLKIGSRFSQPETLNALPDQSPVCLTIEQGEYGSIRCFWVKSDRNQTEYHLIGVIPEYSSEQMMSFFRMLDPEVRKFLEALNDK